MKTTYHQGRRIARIVKFFTWAVMACYLLTICTLIALSLGQSGMSMLISTLPALILLMFPTLLCCLLGLLADRKSVV